MSRGLRDIIFGLFALAVGGLLWWETMRPKYVVDKVQDYGFDPAFFPRILIALWIILSIAIIVRALRLLSEPIDGQSWSALAGSLAITAAYLVAMNWIGFLLSSIAFAAVMMLFLGFRRPLFVAVLAVLIGLIIWYCFVFLLKIPLPSSPWFTRI